jgi:multisubunit Na+/H+ antiporter MnhB subunit
MSSPWRTARKKAWPLGGALAIVSANLELAVIDLAYSIMIGLAFVAGTIALMLAAYFLTRRISGGDPQGKHREMANSMVVRIAALHALILALVFAQEMTQYQRLNNQSAIEVNALADVYNDAARYGDEARAPVQQAVSEYVIAVLSQEWHTLGRSDRLSDEAWADWETIYSLVLDLVPTNPRQASLRDHMLAQIHAISGSRDQRENTGADALTGMFWFAALTGVILMAVGYYVYPPERYSIVLISLWGAYTGVILFLIFAFSDPFSSPGALAPVQFEIFADEIGLAVPPR